LPARTYSAARTVHCRHRPAAVRCCGFTGFCQESPSTLDNILVGVVVARQGRYLAHRGVVDRGRKKKCAQWLCPSAANSNSLPRADTLDTSSDATTMIDKDGSGLREVRETIRGG